MPMHPERRLTLALALVSALLAGLIVYAFTLRHQLKILSPSPEERHLVDRAIKQLARQELRAAEWRNGTYPVVIYLDQGRACVDLKPRRRNAPSGLVCFGRSGEAELEIVHGPPIGR